MCTYDIFAQGELYLSSPPAWADADPTGEADVLQDVYLVGYTRSLTAFVHNAHCCFQGPLLLEYSACFLTG